MIRIAKWSIRHPWPAIAVWVTLAIGLGALGSQIETHFAPSIIVAKGTESAKAEKLATSRFGASVLTPIMITGPAEKLDKQGPPLVAKLRARTDTRVLSPWDGTPGSGVLRPSRTAATIVAAVERPEKQVISTALPQIERTVHQSISGPVKVHITGQAVIDRAMRDESLRQTKIAVAIAIPFVLLVLMLVLRAPVAALLVTGFAASVLPVGYGLTAIAAQIIKVDAIAAAGAAMVGLALSVGFGVLMVARFRETLAEGRGDSASSVRAAVEASTTAGRAVLIAGTATVIALVIASVLSMPDILNSIGVGAVLMAFVASAAAVGVLPAALRLTGTHVAAVSAGTRVPGAGGRHFSAALGAAAALAALALMVALSAPVMSLSSGPPDAKLLPSHSNARQDYEAVARVMGPGWVTPFEVVVARGNQPITTREFLGDVNWLERTIGQDSAVKSVLGPGALLVNANELQGVPKGLNTAAATATQSKKDLKKLIAGLRLATGGVAQLRGGLGTAAGGAGQLHGGTGQAYSGSGQLKTGLDQANAGAQQLKVGAAQAAAGANDLAGGLLTAKQGVAGGMPAIQALAEAVKANSTAVGQLPPSAATTNAEIAGAASALADMTVGRDDQRYASVVSALERAAAANSTLASGLSTVARDASYNAIAAGAVVSQVKDLQKGINKLQAGSAQLSTGLHQLSGGNGQLASGIAQLDSGGAQLQDGLRQLNDGAGQLAVGLASGAGPSGELLAGMHTITNSVVKARAGIPSTKDLVKLRKEAPGLFDSGYFVLAAIDGAPRAARDAAAFVLNLQNGGHAGRITVVPKSPARTAESRALHERLSHRVAAFAAAYHAQAAVGGTAADLIDYRNLGLDKVPVVVFALALLTFAVLSIMTRSWLVPALAVVLNLLTVTAAFGVLALLFNGSSPLLGGPGFVDPVTIIAVSTIVLALSIDYEVFALKHLRLITGAGLAMLAVLLPFIPSDVTLVRQFAIGMAVAVVIDSLIVRRLLVRAARPRGRTTRRRELWKAQPSHL